MTELWTFMEKPIVGGEHDTQNERDFIGGLSLSQFFCKNKRRRMSKRKYIRK